MPLTLDDLANFSLDSIITHNRDRVSIGLADDAEITNMTAILSETVAFKDTIDDWHLIAYRLVGDEPTVVLLGDSRANRNTWITSMVQHVDLDHGIVRTLNSYYRLGNKGTDEVSIAQLFLLVQALRNQGLQNALGLPDVTG